MVSEEGGTFGSPSNPPKHAPRVISSTGEKSHRRKKIQKYGNRLRYRSPLTVLFLGKRCSRRRNCRCRCGYGRRRGWPLCSVVERALTIDDGPGLLTAKVRREVVTGTLCRHRTEGARQLAAESRDELRREAVCRVHDVVTFDGASVGGDLVGVFTTPISSFS